MRQFGGPSDSFIPLHLQELVSAELDEDEHIVWQAQPKPGLYSRRAWPIVLFGIPWTGFAVFWIFGAAGFKWPTFQSGADLFPLFGVPFVLIGLGLLSTPLWMRRAARRTIYVITDRRAIVIGGAWALNVESFQPSRLHEIRRKQRRDGSGDLIFRTEVSQNRDGRTRESPVGFMAIADVKGVEDLIRDLVARAESASPPAD